MIFKSPYPDIEIPDVPVSKFATQHAKRLNEKPAFVEGVTGNWLSHGEMARQIELVATNLAHNGIRKGDVVGIYSSNCLEYPVAFHAITSLGAIASLVNYINTAEELHIQIKRDRMAVLLVSPELLANAFEAKRDTGIRKIFVFGESDEAIPFRTLFDPSPALPTIGINPAKDIAAILSSSGTTGASKGVLLTHRNLVAMGAVTVAPGHIQESDRIAATIPFFHVYGVLALLVGSCCAGGTTILLPRFEPEGFLELLEQNRITTLAAVPPMLVALTRLAHDRSYDLAALRQVLSGAAPLSAELEQEAKSLFQCFIGQGYGMTEFGPATIAPDHAPASKQGTVGCVLPNVEMMIVSVANREARGPNQSGEVLLRGPQAMVGYLDQQIATAEALDEEGWLHTGDIGYVDDDGYLFIVDRLKEMIKYKAHQVAPAELEAILLTHPAVADAAVVRFPDEAAGEVPKAFVVLRATSTAEELMDFVAHQVAPYKKVRRVEFIDAIPKSVSGKILRRELVSRDAQSMITV